MGGALVVSDLHAHNWPRFSKTLENGRNSRFDNLLGVLSQVEQLVLELAPDYLFILGDLTHRRFTILFSVYNELMDAIHRMSSKVDQTYLLVGNHDLEGKGVHSLAPFAYIDGITVVEAPKRAELKIGTVSFFPYMEGARVAESVRASGPSDYAFFHHMLDGHVLHTEHEYALESPLLAGDVLSKFGKSFFGHVHTPSIEHQGKIIYVGAPMHMDFGDTGERYCWHLKDDGGVDSYLLSAPEFRTSYFPRVPVPPKVGGFLRILGVPKGEMLVVKKQALDLGWFDAVPLEEDVPSEAVRVIATRMVVGETVLREYVVRQYPDLAPREHERLVQVGCDLLREAGQ